MFNIFKKKSTTCITYTVEFHLSSGAVYKIDNAKDKNIDLVKRIMKEKGWLTFDLIGWQALNLGCVEKITITQNN